MKQFIVAGLIALATLISSPAQAQDTPSYFAVRVRHAEGLGETERSVIRAVKQALYDSDTFAESRDCTTCMVLILSLVEVQNGHGEVLGHAVGYTVTFKSPSSFDTFLVSGVMTGGTSAQSEVATANQLMNALKAAFKALGELAESGAQDEPTSSRPAPFRKKV